MLLSLSRGQYDHGAAVAGGVPRVGLEGSRPGQNLVPRIPVQGVRHKPRRQLHPMHHLPCALHKAFSNAQAGIQHARPRE